MHLQSVVWDTPCGLVVDRHFRGTYYLSLQGWRDRQASKQGPISYPWSMFFPEILNKWLILISLLIDLLRQGTYYPAHLNVTLYRYLRFLSWSCNPKITPTTLHWVSLVL
jgi:hypothetical protein